MRWVRNRAYHNTYTSCLHEERTYCCVATLHLWSNTATVRRSQSSQSCVIALVNQGLPCMLPSSHTVIAIHMDSFNFAHLTHSCILQYFNETIFKVYTLTLRYQPYLLFSRGKAAFFAPFWERKRCFVMACFESNLENDEIFVMMIGFHIRLCVN